MQRDASPNRLVGKDAIRKYRADANVCEALVARLYADPNVRSACLMQLAESILDAHAISASSWGVTLHESEIRLNVGAVETLVLSKEALSLSLDKAATTDDEWTHVTTQPGVTFRWGGGPFKSIPSAYGVLISGNQLELRLPELQPLHAAFVARAAKTVQTRTRHFESHSPSVMGFLRKEIADDLPDPDYGMAQSPNAYANRGYWKINPGEGAKYWNEFQQRQMIAIGWDEGVDLRTLHANSEDELKQRLNDHPDKGDYDKRDHGARQLWRFYHDMQIGDWVCVYGKSAVLGWGMITGDYQYEHLLDRAHQRSVNWHSTQPLSILDLPEPLAARLSHQHTVLAITEEDFAQITQENPQAPFDAGGDVPEITGEFDDLMLALKSSGLYFSSEVVSNYLLALQSKRLVILTGISGTGKTQLALTAARHFLQHVLLPRATSLSEGAHAQKVEPYMRDHKRYTLPASFTAGLDLPTLDEELADRQVRVIFPGGEQQLTLSRRSSGNTASVLNFRGGFGKWFLETLAPGDIFAIEPIESDDGAFHGFRISVPTTVEHLEPLENHIVSAVKPDWSDNRGLLGYFNPLIGSYVVTPFLQLLLDAQAEVERAEREGREPAPFFVILDEMNLARVEHYFSAFLSALESGEPIHLHDHEGIEEGETEDSVRVPRSLRVPENVFFTGTVNVDETTYMFSPKVLDRAFTIELNRVDLESFSSEQPEEADAFTLSQFAGSLGTARKPNRDDWVAFGELMDGALRQVVLDIHALLSEEDRHFGFRVANEIARFVLLANKQTDGSNDALWTALDLAVLQKILPKFHGTQQELEEILTRLSEFVAPLPLPRIAAKLQSMQRRLKRQGFTSFIE